MLLCKQWPMTAFRACMTSCDLQAAAPALCDWIAAVEAAGSDWDPVDPRLDHLSLLPGLFRLDYSGLLHTLICTAITYLDSPRKWYELVFEQNGLHNLLCHLAVSMRSSARALLDQSKDMASAMATVDSFFDALSTASRLCCTPSLHVPEQDQMLLQCSRQSLVGSQQCPGWRCLKRAQCTYGLLGAWRSAVMVHGAWCLLHMTWKWADTLYIPKHCRQCWCLLDVCNNHFVWETWRTL